MLNINKAALAAYFFLITQVYIGSNFERYETRPRYNIDWNKINPLVLNDGKDTIYHYTVKYWEKPLTLPKTREMAKAMRDYGDPVEKIAAISGLSVEEIAKL